MTIHKDILSFNAKLRTALIKGHYKYISRDANTAQIEVSGIPLELWLPACAPQLNFKIWTVSESAIFGGVFTSDEDRLAAYETIMRIMEESAI